MPDNTRHFRSVKNSIILLPFPSFAPSLLVFPFTSSFAYISSVRSFENVPEGVNKIICLSLFTCPSFTLDDRPTRPTNHRSVHSWSPCSPSAPSEPRFSEKSYNENVTPTERSFALAADPNRNVDGRAARKFDDSEAPERSILASCCLWFSENAEYSLE